MKINAFLSGGKSRYSSIVDPFTAQLSTPKLLEQPTKSLSILDDDIINKIYDKGGIPVDVDNYLEKVALLEYEQSMGLPISSGAIRLLQALGNRVIQLANYLEAAEKNASKNDAIGEVAVGNSGGRVQLYVRNPKTDKIQQIDVTNYDPEKHGPAMTVNELIEHRKFNPTQAFDSNLTLVIGSNIGMNKIADFILNIIKTVGSTHTVSEAYTDLAGYIGKLAAKRPSESELQNLLYLYQAMQQLGSDAIFKNKQVMESKNMQEALSYIESVLPPDMKKLLIGRYVAYGNDYKNAGRYMEDVIALAFLSANTVKAENYLDYEASLNKAAGTQSGKQYDQKRNLTSLEILIQGSLNKTDYDIVSSKNPSVGMTLHGNSVGALTNYDNNVVPKAPISTAIESSIGPLVDKNHVTMGSLKISESMFDTIMYDGNDVLNVWAPVDSNGDIDLSGMKVFNELLDHFESDPSLSIQDKNNMLKYYGIQGYIDQNGQFVGTGNMALFLVFTGITSDEVISKEDDFVDVLSDDKKKFELDQIERVYGYLNGKNKNKHSKYEFKKGWFDWSTDIVKAPVFMKLKNSAQTQVGAFSNHGPLINTPTYLDNLAQDQMRYNRQHQLVQITLPSSNILFLE